MFDERPAWHRDALCNTGDASLVDVFFGGDRQDYDGERAKEICAMCPVADECLTDALDRVSYYDFGVWGGTTLAERNQIRRHTEATAS
jgi:hypothetical protein